MLRLKKEEEEKKKEKAPHPKLEGNILFDFIKMLHGSYWSIRKIREKFQTPHPEISARLIKKKVPEIAQKREKGKGCSSKITLKAIYIEKVLRKERILPRRGKYYEQLTK